jgi:hypothetical protein
LRLRVRLFARLGDKVTSIAGPMHNDEHGPPSARHRPGATAFSKTLVRSPVSPVYVRRAPRTFSDLPEIVEFSLGSYPPKGGSEGRAQGDALVGTKSYFLLPGRRG